MSVDPAAPLKNAIHETMLHASLKRPDVLLVDIYATIKRKKPGQYNRGSYQITANAIARRPDYIARRAWLVAQATGDLIMGLEERKRALSLMARERLKGLKPFMVALPDGEQCYDVNQDNITEAVKSVKQYIREDGVVIRDIEIKDAEGPIKELNKMEHVYAEDESEGPIILVVEGGIPMPGGTRHKEMKHK